MKKGSSEKVRHVVAWINKAEWDQVLEYLYSKDSTLQRQALQRISAWKGRYVNSTPVAVDCTADLIRCQALDRSGQLEGDDLVLLYGAALVRFINVITERQQGRIARPLKHLAGNLNIPEWVVELRHDFTHRKRPTLKWCRKGCKVVLKWLHQEYWSRQFGGASNVNWEFQSDGEEDEELDLKRQEDKLIASQKEMEAYKTARDLLITFEKEQYQALDKSQQQKCPGPFSDMSWLLGEVKQFSMESSDLLIDVMLEDGFLVPTVPQLESLRCESSDSDTEPRLPQTFLRFWLPLLKMLNSSSFIHLFLEKLFVELKVLVKEKNHHRAYYISAWISEVILCNCNKFDQPNESKGQRKARMKDKIFVNRIELRWQQLLSACLEAPCISTPHLLQLILNDMEHPLPPETQQRLLQLCSIYTQPTNLDVKPSSENKHPVYTLESLHEKLKHLQHQSHASHSTADSERSDSSQEYKCMDAVAEKLRGSPWQVCTDKVVWKNYPLGKVPGQSNDPSCLMAENYSTLTVFDQPVELDSNKTHDVPGVSAPVRTSDGLIWNHSDINKLKSGLQLF
ncbi:ribosomal biogenesis protein LAS1L [Betta splendens]|uniref:Ribosomal biogenesis protein LAS1L n=1 Tax=Betta splendens TaxID=158456 RepID=A0A6P7N5G3_BETSP|nr:ribosomal biogenesis protein LAS1L [Betta splendens]